MLHRVIYSLALGVFTLMLSWACKPDEPIKKEAEVPAKLDFDTYEYYPVSGIMHKFYTDSVIAGGIIYFELKGNAEAGTKYTWLIGTDTTKYKGKLFSLFFDEKDVSGQTIPITLIKTKDQSKVSDSVTKYLYFVPQKRKRPWYGAFKGTSTAGSKELTIIIEDSLEFGPGRPPTPTIKGIPENCKSKPHGIGGGWNWIKVSDLPCYAGYAVGKLSKDHQQLELEYWITDPTKTPSTKYYKFIGKRLY